MPGARRRFPRSGRYEGGSRRGPAWRRGSGRRYGLRWETGPRGPQPTDTSGGRSMSRSISGTRNEVGMKNERGSALVITLMLLLILTAIGIYAIRVSTTAMDVPLQAQGGVGRLHAAGAG